MRENRVYENNFLTMDFIARKLRFEKSKCKKKEGKSYKTKKLSKLNYRTHLYNDSIV